MKQTIIQGPKVLTNHKQLLKRDAHLRRFGCDLRAGITFVLEQALPLESPVLEIGTGKGRFLVKLAKCVRDITTVDISAEEQQSARLNARFHKVQDRIKFVLQNAVHLPWPDHSFGAVVTMNAMHHIREFEPVLEEMLRVVRPGGKLVLADFTPRGFQNIARAHRAEGKIHPREPHSFRDLQQRLRKRGLATRLRKGCNEEVIVVQVPNISENKVRTSRAGRIAIRKHSPQLGNSGKAGAMTGDDLLDVPLKKLFQSFVHALLAWVKRLQSADDGTAWLSGRRANQSANLAEGAIIYFSISFLPKAGNLVPDQRPLSLLPRHS